MKLSELSEQKSYEPPKSGGGKAAYNQGFSAGKAGTKPIPNPEKSFGVFASDYNQGYKAGAAKKNPSIKMPHYSDFEFGERHAADSRGRLD